MYKQIHIMYLFVQCKEMKKRVDESSYPYNHKSPSSLSNIDSPVSSTGGRRSTRNARAPLAKEDVAAPQSTVAAPVSGASGDELPDTEDTQTGLAETLYVLKQLRSYMKKRFVLNYHL